MTTTISKTVDFYIVYRILRLLSTPFDQTDAFKLGIIDKDGNVLKKMNTLKTPAEQNAYTYLVRFVFNLKKILNKIPGLKSRLGTLALATYFLLKEDESIEWNTQFIIESIDLDALNVKPFQDFLLENYLIEEVPANSVGGGGVNLDPVVKKKQVDHSEFAGCRVYHVDDTTFSKITKGKKKQEKFSKYVDDPDLLGHVRDYAQKNPKSSIMMMNKSTNSRMFLKYGRQNELGAQLFRRHQ